MQRELIGAIRPLRQVTGWSWGPAGSALVRLQGRGPGSAVVLWAQYRPPTETVSAPAPWPIPSPAEPGRANPRAWPRPRLAAVWPDERCQQGQVEAKHTGAGRPVLAEAQWDAAQALGLADHAVHLDLWPEPSPHGPRRWHWVAASRPDLQEFAQSLRAAGWHLIGAEPETWSARRAWSGLQGGEATVHSRAVEDWRWNPPTDQAAHAPLDARLEALRQQISPRTWLMLCAWGAALGAWT